MVNTYQKRETYRYIILKISLVEDVSYKIHPVNDVPTNEARLLEHREIIRNLKSFLESERMITPISIAIHGEWGSGKTSIMKTLENQLDSSKFETLFFEAWKYEYSNPSLGLITEIAGQYATDDIANRIIKTGLYILTKKYLGVDSEQVIKLMRNSKTESDTLSDTLRSIIKEKIGDKKLIIIIDDLDRCDVENSLQLLALLKLFFDIENCICIAAVDFERLKQAWIQKYQNKDKQTLDGSNYLDKIFQIIIGIPKPSSKQIEEYVRTLVDNMPRDIAKMFSLALPKNPRSIKKTLNLISYRINMIEGNHKEFAAIFWTLLEEVISNKSITSLHERLTNKGNSLGHLIVDGGNWNHISEIYKESINPKITMEHSGTLNPFFSLSQKIARKNDITRDDLNPYFRILYDATNESLRYSDDHKFVQNNPGFL